MGFHVDGERGASVRRGNAVYQADGRAAGGPGRSSPINGQPREEGPLSRITLPDFPAQRVPPGRLFVMGDNPPKSFRPISEEAVKGRVRAILYPLSFVQELKTVLLPITD